MVRLILNGINGEYLRDITENAKADTEHVDAAVAYATEETLLFDWCWSNSITLRFWGRLDPQVPVYPHILRTFLARRSPNYVCKLVTKFHPKVIWWHGVGAYIGSANLTNAAWHGNVEAGTFFTEDELETWGMAEQLREFFRIIDDNASPLTEELVKAIEQRQKELNRIKAQDAERAKRFMETPAVRRWDGLVHKSRPAASERRKNAFLHEWHETLQILRDIGATISKSENRPRWIPAEVPAGAQADQFLHAHYYNNVIDESGRSRFKENFEVNKANPAAALDAAIAWWRGLKSPPSSEDRMLLDWAPFLREALTRHGTATMGLNGFKEVCRRVWSIQDHARRVANATLNLPDGVRYDMETKTTALSEYLFNRRSQNSSTVVEVIRHVLYGGTEENLPIRLWEATTVPAWRIEHLGISALGEIVGWALPDRFPPRNNRTSKSLRSLGFPVSAHD